MLTHVSSRKESIDTYPTIPKSIQLYCVTQNTLKNKKEKSPLQPTYFKSGSFTVLPHKFKKKKTLDFHTIQITHKYSNAAS